MLSIRPGTFTVILLALWISQISLECLCDFVLSAHFLKNTVSLAMFVLIVTWILPCLASGDWKEGDWMENMSIYMSFISIFIIIFYLLYPHAHILRCFPFLLYLSSSVFCNLRKCNTNVKNKHWPNKKENSVLHVQVAQWIYRSIWM